MLSGTLIYKGTKYGDLRYNVLGRDSFNDLKLQLTADGVCDISTYEYKTDLYDIDESGIVPDQYKMIVGKDKEIRRLDVKKTNKYKSTITNKEFATKISALIRYMQISGKQMYNQQISNEFSPIRTVDVIEIKTKQKIGTIKYNMGLITDLYCENKYLKLELKTIPDTNFEESIFKELKEKDKFGRKLYSTPVSIVGFKLNEEVLGFPYIPEVVKELTQSFGMYETIEDVIAAHPEKNTKWILDQDYHIVTDDTLEDVMKMFYEHEGLIAYDTETSGLNINFKSRTNEADQLVGVVLSRKPGEGYYFPLQHKLFPNLCGGDHFYFMEKYMRKLLEEKKIICHNLKFDWKVAYIYDINVNCVYDTMLVLGVTKRYEEESYALGLKDLTKNIFGRDSFELSDFVMGGDFGSSDIAFWDLPYELVRQYAPADTDNTYALYEFIEKEDILNKYDARKVFEMEINFAKAVAYSEFYGYHIDVENIPELQDKIVGEMERCKKEMFKIAGEEFNPNSPAQLVTIMYDKLGVERVGEKASTDKETLKTLASRTNPDGSPKYPFVKLLKTYRDNESIYKNFLKRLPEFATTDGYIFPDVLQIGTNTGRVSVKNPNYQGYNDIVKHYVVPRPEFMHFDSDFAQIEQRVLVSYASIMFNDFTSLALLKDFDDPDMDYHQYQAARMFNVPYAAVTKAMRQQSKGINFGLPYGMGDESLGTRIFGERNKENTKKAAELRKKFFQGQELIEQFFEKVRSEGVREGYTKTQWGRRRYYHKGVFSVAEIRRQAGNHCIQGCIFFDTKINTKEYGIVKIGEVAGQHLHVWDGEKWTEGDITYSGKKRKTIVTFTNGLTMICSPIHKFQVVSHKGNKRFVDAKDLKTKEMEGTTHRVVINQNYEPSDFKYSSDDAYGHLSYVHNANNFFLDDIGNSFKIGLFLGRLASDGSYYGSKDGNIKAGRVRHIIAEHEYNIIPKLKECMKNYTFFEKNNEVRENRNQKMTYIDIYSKSLNEEIIDLDIKHKIHDNIFMDTELLRGFLSGMFDGDGGITGKAITLTFGNQYNFEPMCLDIQKALLFFGIRSRYRKYEGDRYVIQIQSHDVPKFLDMIGFINEDKQAKGRTLTHTFDDHVFGPCLIPKSVEITDEYIDMYDVCNTERGYYVADGVVTHNTAADIYKQAVNNMFNRICKEGWLGKVLINGFIHDEMLMEVHKSINPYYFFKAWREEFEVRPAKYCRLYAGAGVGKCWYDAKKLDLHPLYIDEIINSYTEDMPWDEDTEKFLSDIKIGFKKHKTKRIRDYILDEENQGQIIKPAIGAMLGDEIEIILGDILNNADLVEQYNNILVDNKLEYKGNSKIKGLQDQLRAYCKYYNVDYDSIDIKSLEDVKIETKDIGSDNLDEEEDVIEVQVNKEELLLLSLLSNGIIIDQETRTVHMAEIWLNTKDGYIQGTKYFLEKYMITKGNQGYKIMYYPNLMGDKPKGQLIPGFCVPFENGSVLIHFYKEMLSKNFARLYK